MGNRTGQQCAQRWRHKVNPDLRKAKWTAEEDGKLAALVAEHGKQWAVISRQMDGRSDQQVMVSDGTSCAGAAKAVVIMGFPCRAAGSGTLTPA